MSELNSGKHNILVVDDQPEALSALVSMLTDQGYVVETAANGRLALQKAWESLPDLILLDVCLPDLDGYEVCKLLKADERSQDIPVIFVSVRGDTQDKIEAFAAGGVDYVTKPLRVEELLARLETHLTLRAMRRQIESRNLQLKREIAERERVEQELRRQTQALRESEGKYRGLIEQSLQGVVIAQSNPVRLSFASKPMEAITGFSPEELEDFGPQRLASLIHPKDREIFFRNFQDRLSGKKIAPRREYRIIHKSGDVRWVETYSSRIEYAGSPATQTVFLDVTERRRTEETLRDSEERFRSIAETASDAIVIFDVEENVFFWNQAARVIFGYEAGETRGKLLASIIPHQFHALFREEMKRALAAEIPRDIGRAVEMVGLKKDGSQFPLELSLASWSTVEGSFFTAIIRDITERKQMEQEIEERRVYLEGVLASAPCAIVTLDFENRILEWNPGAENLFGYSSEKAVGCNIDELIAGGDANMAEEAAGFTRRTLVGESVTPTETVRYRKDGVPIHVIFAGSPIMVEGEVVGVIATYADITERVRAEEARQEMEQQLQQQERLAAIGQLAGGIAHDFNNLLTSIMLYAQIVRDKPHLPADVAPAVGSILEESRRAARLVQQILDFSRRAMMKVRPIDLASSVEKAIGILQRTLPESIHLTLEVGPEEYIVNADPTRIQQVLMNLATNARDAMTSSISVEAQEGGELRIALSRVRVGADDQPPVAEMERGEWACLSVSDTGTGMTEEVQAHLFEPFFTTKEVGEGTGLGLAQVHGIVKQHGGYIGVDTEVGRGTTFRIYLPVYEEELEERVEQVSAPPSGRGETILLVEDEEKLRQVGREILQSLNYRVLTAADGREALEVYTSAEAVDLLVADVVMPRLGGARLLQKLRELNPDLKALAITGYVLSEDLEALREKGFCDIIRKPFEIDTIAGAVRRTLDAG